MNVFDDFEDDVEKGIRGQNLGLSTGLSKFDKLIGKVQGSTYYLIGGNTGTGKTAFVDFCFVLSPYADYLKQTINRHLSEAPLIKLRVFYYSFEIAAKVKIAKWVCALMYYRYGMIIDIKEVYSRNSILSEEKYQLIKGCRQYVEQMMEHVHIFDHPMNPYGIYKEVSDYMNVNGKEINVIKVIKGKEFTFKKYIPNDPYEIVLVIEDHIGLARKEKDLLTKKDIIDKGSENAITLRNRYGVSKVAVSQFNRDLADIDRRRFTELTPQLEDFKNTGNVAEDCNIAMTLFNPDRYNLNEYSGIQRIKDFGGRYRSLSLLKFREGGDMIKHDLNFCGENGVFRELPVPFMQHNYKEAREFTKFT